jgi:hypothetical protein
MGLFVHLNQNPKNKEIPMDPRERLLGIGKLYLKRGEPIPVTLLAEAEELGLSLSEFGLPTTSYSDDNNQEGDI